MVSIAVTIILPAAIIKGVELINYLSREKYDYSIFDLMLNRATLSADEIVAANDECGEIKLIAIQLDPNLMFS